VAHAQVRVVIRRERGQVLAFFALLLPIVLMPVAAYAVDSVVVSTHAAGLQEATVQAAEEAAQQLSVTDLRTRREVALDSALARNSALATMSAVEPGASVQAVLVDGTQVTVITAELVSLPFNFLPVPSVKLAARASARLVSGYDSPSSRLPLPTSSF
jgi:hypothetical protein